MSGSWFARPRARPDAELRLVCFPYAGGSAAPFRRWLDLLPPWLELWTANLPGRERRIGEPAATDLAATVGAAADALDVPLPYALYGHSMGAMIAYELAHELARRGRPTPSALAVSGARAPHVAERRPPLHDLPDDEFMAGIRALEGTPAVLFEQPELLELVLPTLRADFTAVETYAPRDRPPLGTPVLAYAGQADRIVGPEDVAAWAELTAAGCVVRTVDGGHFFVQDDPEAFVPRLVDDLRTVVPNGW